MINPITPYVIDTSAVIDIKNYYSEETFPSLWHDLNSLADAGNLKCPREVLREIKKNQDIIQWLKDRKIVIPDLETQNIAPIAARIDSKYPDLKKGRHSAIAKPASADPWIVALAIHRKAPVVCMEHSTPHSLSIRQIPDVCRLENIRCINLNEWFKELALKY